MLKTSTFEYAKNITFSFDKNVSVGLIFVAISQYGILNYGAISLSSGKYTIMDKQLYTEGGSIKVLTYLLKIENVQSGSSFELKDTGLNGEDRSFSVINVVKI